MLTKQTSVLGLPNSRGFSVNTSATGKPGGRGIRRRGKLRQFAVWRVETRVGEGRQGTNTEVRTSGVPKRVFPAKTAARTL